MRSLRSGTKSGIGSRPAARSLLHNCLLGVCLVGGWLHGDVRSGPGSGMVFASGTADERADFFRENVAPIFARRCIGCHNDEQRKGDFSLESAAARESGYLEPGDPEASYLLELVTSGDPRRRMPKDADPLEAQDIETLRRWIRDGATWPDEYRVEPWKVTDTDWWSLRPLLRPSVPDTSPTNNALRISSSAPSSRPSATHPIDAFVRHKLAERGLSPSPEADRRTLIRRLYFDLWGLPPSTAEIEAFLADPAPDAYERLVDRLLASPRYGERWARHWLDVVHYADTHGFDKDKVRPHAWPYRDYVIRALNDGKPYARFVEEQLAGDVLYPDTRDGIEALGCVAVGPFDFVGQIEVRNETLEKRRVRNLDRDDMVTTVMNAFVSSTVQCARCHNHKFDPITQEDYYQLQAVFAGVDRADRAYDIDPRAAERRTELETRKTELARRRQELSERWMQAAGSRYPELLAERERLDAQRQAAQRPEFGYHSQIESREDVTKWVQVDLGRPTTVKALIYAACHDDFNGIGAGFGFPRRYRIQGALDPEFQQGVVTLVDFTDRDAENPGVAPLRVEVDGPPVRFVRFTATRLAPRKDDYILALAELMVLDEAGQNAALGQPVTSLDSIEAPVRWGRINLVDGYFFGVDSLELAQRLAALQAEEAALRTAALTPDVRAELTRLDDELARTEAEQQTLSSEAMVYALAAEFQPQGNFQPTHGQPRPVHLLHRGNETSPVGEPLAAAGLSCLPDLAPHFELPSDHAEGQRRAALARWITDPRNPLTWRSIVNRVWHYHFGQGLVTSPNDFGRMGDQPSHPELLDWLAVEFRDGDQSLKSLHRLIVTSGTYRQVSTARPEPLAVDADNRLLWRMNRQRLDAETIRDSVLHLAECLDLRMYGPGFRAFGFQDDHSPHYKYDEYDPADRSTHRRSVYRFVVRSVPDPFMTTLDCADPSQLVAKRLETVTPLQSLAMLNNPFMVEMARQVAERADGDGRPPEEALAKVFAAATGRSIRSEELQPLTEYARQFGLPAACRVLLNLNEFVYVD